MTRRDQRRSLVFDWGGVIMVSVDRGPRHAWDRRLGLPEGTVESVVHGISAWRDAQCGRVTLDAYWQAVQAELHLTPDQLVGLQRDFYSGDQLNEELVTLIRELRHNKVPVGLMSNNTLNLRDSLAAFEIGDLFDASVISAEIGIMKPDSGAYQAILDKMHIPAEAAIFVDDFIENVEGARAVGMQAVHYRPTTDLRAILKSQYGIPV